MSTPSPTTLGELRALKYRPRSVKDEIRSNLLRALRDGKPLFPSIIGYDRTVVPQLVNALLARHDLILLGLRGQAKTRLARLLTQLLDEWTPTIAGSKLNEDPLAPITDAAKALVHEAGDSLPIAWLHRDQRYAEKLATPDVSIADLIGDIDPITPPNLHLDHANPQIIHYGLVPRANRGVFCINELPDLAPRIQVVLLNILQERDVQIRSFPLRLPLDLLMLFTANPEDYTNRASIITPLKDRIQSQIHTHYPAALADALKITAQEAWTNRDGGVCVRIPRFLLEAVEEVAFQARKSEYLDPSSGVSARLPISLLECLVSNAERRAVLLNASAVSVRPVDFQQAVPAITGKIELVYQGQQHGPVNVARHLISHALRNAFDRYLPELASPDAKPDEVFGPYKPIVDYFTRGNAVQVADSLSDADAAQRLAAIDGLEILARRYLPMDDPALELAAAMELILEGLHHAQMIGKDELDGVNRYYDPLGDMLEDIDQPC